MTYAAWEPRHRFTTITPGKWDLFVAVLVNGRRATLDPISNYDVVVAQARAFHRDHPCQVKVLPLTGEELRNLFGLQAAAKPDPMDDAMRQQLVATLTDVAANSNDGDARRDAMSLLSEMGVLVS